MLLCMFFPFVSLSLLIACCLLSMDIGIPLLQPFPCSFAAPKGRCPPRKPVAETIMTKSWTLRNYYQWFDHVHVLMAAAARMKPSVASIPCLLTGTALGIRVKGLQKAKHISPVSQQAPATARSTLIFFGLN